jgi:hypothetical protein
MAYEPSVAPCLAAQAVRRTGVRIVLGGANQNGLAQSSVTIDQLLSQDQQLKLGVAAMSAEQQALLTQILVSMFRQGYQAGKSAGQPTALPPPSGVIESQVDGEFNSWDGDTIVKLTNGQIWQQATYYYEYHYAYMPNVLVYQFGAGYKMKVDGVSEDVDVQRLR